MSSKMVSIIIPVYNVQDYIQDCLKSVLEQSYQNIEIIVVDDGSEDNTFEICKSLFSEKDNCKLIHQENQGVSSARNQGLKATEGDYIVFVDGDDLLCRDAVERMVMAIGDCDLVSGPIYEFTHDYQEKKESITCDDTIVDRDTFVKKCFKNRYLFVCGRMYKKEIIAANNILFDEELIYAEDVEWLMRYIVHADKMAYCSKGGYIRKKRRENSAMTEMYSGNSAKYFDSAKKAYKKAYNTLTGINSKMNVYAYKMYVVHQRRYVDYLSKHTSDKSVYNEERRKFAGRCNNYLKHRLPPKEMLFVLKNVVYRIKFAIAAQKMN